MKEDRSKYIQLVVRRKPNHTVFLRALPCTAYNPTENQIRARIAFAEAAKKAKGVRYKGQIRKGDIPPAARAVREAMKGKKFGRKTKTPKWVEVLRDFAKEEGLSEEEIMKMYEALRYSRGEIGSYP